MSYDRIRAWGRWGKGTAWLINILKMFILILFTTLALDKNYFLKLRANDCLLFFICGYPELRLLKIIRVAKYKHFFCIIRIELSSGTSGLAESTLTPVTISI